MRDWAKEKEARVSWIKNIVASCGAKGVVFGNSGGKDCALTGILCKAACLEKTIGVIMPCESRQNYTTDSEDAKRLAEKFGIETRIVDITQAKHALTLAARNAINDSDAETVKKIFGKRKSPSENDDVISCRADGRLPCRRYGQQKRKHHGIFYQMGGRRLRFQSDRRPDRAGSV